MLDSTEKLKKNDGAERIAVLEKAIKIINLLETSKNGIGLTEISKLTAINKTSCYRILQTLMSDNIIEYGLKPGTYRLGTRLLELGNAVQKRLNVREAALPILQKLTSTTEDTSYLCLFNKGKALCVERVPGLHFQILILDIGDIWPLYKGAAPRAILAFLEDEKIKNILSSFEESSEEMAEIVNPSFDYYWQMVTDTREKGYSVSYEDVITGVASIGAPIFDHSGNVIASISLSSTIQRLSKEREPEIGELLVNAAEEISQALGWNP